MTTPPGQLPPTLERALGKFSGILQQVWRRYRLSGSEVDELIQQVRTRLIASVSVPSLHRAALSAAIDMVRRRRARRGDRTMPIDDEHEPLTESRGPDHEPEPPELAAQVERAIESIHPSRRPVVRMHLLGHSPEEIAQLLGWTDAKTRSLLYPGLADVQEHLTAQGARWRSRT